MKPANGYIRASITLRGVVQGVGFRPLVHRLAHETGIAGWVKNSSEGLFIEAEAERERVDAFLLRVLKEKPPLSVIYSSETSFLDPAGYGDFVIAESESSGETTALILPDIALCGDCLREMNDPSNRRYRYPFINCTHCGPRYSIIRSLPYDRPNTTMNGFTMCPECEREYRDPGDRRFHAQPIACSRCGPHLELWNRRGEPMFSHDEALLESVRALKLGNIVALKGLGGFQLLADAANANAVKELRKRKNREEKPFALMFPSIDRAKEVCEVSPNEERLLLSPQSPIVLLKRKIAPDAPNAEETGIATCVAPGNPYLGVMLPYTPLHHLLMSGLRIPIVATSGNLSDEPMCTDERDALRKLGGIADLFLVHNRPIQRYVDDSIVRVAAERELMIRRARGYAPLPLMSSMPAGEPVLALGAHVKNAVALQKKNMVFVSQHIGDLETPPALECLKNTVEDLVALCDAGPAVVLHDLHPDYASTSFARNLPGKKESYQHHFAHIAACMAENDLNEPLLGIAWDGTGYGLDGTIWGGEFIHFDGSHFSRFASLRTFHLPGGDAAVKESLRSAAGVLYEVAGGGLLDHPLLRDKFSEKEGRLILQMMEKKVNSPRTSSMGRLFDAVGALTGLRLRSNFEGQTAMELEFAAMRGETSERYPFDLVSPETSHTIVDWRPMIGRLADDVLHRLPVPAIARKFHNTLPEMIVAIAREASCKKVLLSGGCFQNILLLETTINRLRQEGFLPYWHQRIPANDGGISVGQLTMHRLNATALVKEPFSSVFEEAR